MPRTKRLPAALATLLALSLSACKPTPEKIATWKGTQHGPQRLRELVQDGKADPSLRALAAAALFELGLGQEAIRDLATATPPIREQTAHEMILPLTALLGDSATKPDRPTRLQIAGKDALFEARADASPADRARIDGLLVSWTTVDLAGRATLGGESSEKILRAVGAAAIRALVPLVRPGADLVLAAQLVGELGDPAATKAAATHLIAVLRRAPRGLTAVNEPPLFALGLLGSEIATACLLEIATQPGGTSREQALFALARGRLAPGDRAALTGALAIAGDARSPGEVREAAFGVLEKLGPTAVSGVVRSFTDRDSTVRFRAVEAALKAGGVSAIAPVLAGLPVDRPMKSEDLDSYVVHDLHLLGKEALPALVTAASDPSKPALGRIAALRALGLGGGVNELGSVSALVADGGLAHSLVPPGRVGEEASRAKTAIASRP